MPDMNAEKFRAGLVWDAAAVLDVDGAAMRDERVSKLGVRVLRTGR